MQSALAKQQSQLLTAMTSATTFVKVEAASVPEVQKYIVSETEIAAYVNDKKAKEIFIAIPANADEIAIEFNSTILNTIVQSKKDLIVTRGETTYLTVSKKAVAKLVRQAGGDVTITLSETTASYYSRCDVGKLYTWP